MRYLSIKGVKYTVKLCNPESDYCGLCDLEKKIIWIDKTASKEEKQRTLLHEIGHAIFKELSFDQAISSDVEQILVDNFANVYFDLFFKGTKKKNGKKTKRS